MKEFIDILFDDNKSFDGAPWWVYMFVVPAAFLVLMAIAGTIGAMIWCTTKRCHILTVNGTVHSLQNG